MAKNRANKFATMAHKNTNKITLILIYTVLEWILITLLLITSIFSYFAIKFAQYFGLKPPCFSCARIDENKTFRHRFCEIHSKKVSEFRYLCENCSSPVSGFRKKSRNFVFSKIERIDLMQIDGIEVEKEIEIEKQSSDDEEHETGENEIEFENLIQFDKLEEDLNSLDLEFFIHYSGNQLFPFEEIDSKTEEHEKISQNHEIPESKIEEIGRNFEEDDHEFGDFQKAHLNLPEIDYSVHEKTEDSIKFVENLIDFGKEEVEIDNENEKNQQSDADIHSVHDEDDVSIGAEIPVLDSVDEVKHEHEIHLQHSSSFNNLLSMIENGIEQAYSSKNVDEYEEERHPETPSSIHSLNPFHKKWLDHEPKESEVEESFDGSVGPVNTVEKLKADLKSERKALKDLYSELEEERNASMVAANETMAMINRLQEEKSEMRMEALQYQRMMEEQMEYDREALELVNELMMSKENELESYRKKVLDYEAKEKTRVSQSSTKIGTSSISWSHSDDEDRVSMDLYQIPNDENTLDRNRENLGLRTPVNSVLDLESLANFEEERMSILEELKSLESKLLALSNDEDRHFANIEEINDIGFSSQDTEGTSNEFSNKGKRLMGTRVLPLSDTILDINEDGVTVRNGVMVKTVFNPVKVKDTSFTRFELEKKRLDMEEEIDKLYERLQALEADRAFLKHCIDSTKKGDKGMELLQEILHHLRDLRNVNIRAKNYVDNTFL